MRAFTYILAHDGGFAPNPFHGVCTLACCKPAIRRTARPGDWVIGITPKSRGHDLAYAMEVAEVLSLAEYFDAPRFAAKKPDWGGRGGRMARCGDNCYRLLADGQYEALPSVHNPRSESITVRTNRDLRGKNVLIAKRFVYYGGDAVTIPARLEFMIPRRGHRVRFAEVELRAIEDFVSGLPQGVHHLANGLRAMARGGRAAGEDRLQPEGIRLGEWRLPKPDPPRRESVVAAHTRPDADLAVEISRPCSPRPQPRRAGRSPGG